MAESILNKNAYSLIDLGDSNSDEVGKLIFNYILKLIGVLILRVAAFSLFKVSLFPLLSLLIAYADEYLIEDDLPGFELLKIIIRYSPTITARDFIF